MILDERRLLAAPNDEAGREKQIFQSEIQVVAVDPDEAKVGSTLENVDILFTLEKDRREFFPQLQKQYDIQFVGDITPAGSASFTSQKGIVEDYHSNKYFLKQKPKYSLTEPQKTRAALYQSTLAQTFDFVPPIIETNNGSPYARLDGRYFLLTPFIEGSFYNGKEEQSLACAEVLGKIHKASTNLMPPQDDSIDTTEESLLFINLLEGVDFQGSTIKQPVLSAMQELAHKYKASGVGKKGWLHGDFAPYNMVFNGDKVVAVNDFDNVTYGPISRDIAECLLTHCDINYAGTTSSMRAPIRTVIDIDRLQAMMETYQRVHPLERSDIIDFPNQMSLLWLELMSLGLLRGDFSLKDVNIALPHIDEIHQTASKLIS